MSDIIINSFDGQNYNTLYPSGNSKTLISSETNNYFGLSTNSTITDVLNYIGKYNLYWWKKEDCSFLTSVVSKEMNYTFSDDFATIYYGDSLSLTQKGQLTVNSLKTYSGTRNNVINYAKQNLIGKYCSWNNGAIWNLATGFYASYTVNLFIQGKQYSLKSLSLSNPFYITSTNQEEYPEGYSNGAFYTKLGKPFEKMPQSIKSEKTYYIGTGVYSSTTISISFSFPPDLVIIGSCETPTFLIFG